MESSFESFAGKRKADGSDPKFLNRSSSPGSIKIAVRLHSGSRLLVADRLLLPVCTGVRRPVLDNVLRSVPCDFVLLAICANLAPPAVRSEVCSELRVFVGEVDALRITAGISLVASNATERACGLTVMSGTKKNVIKTPTMPTIAAMMNVHRLPR